tara:strand:- start:159 stop:707 length:549 start_codon:yes stop_codon:yes gene_type:complete
MLHIRHFSDERVQDLEQRDLAQTNGDDEHRSDAGIYGFQVEVDPAHTSATVAYEFIREETRDDVEEFHNIWNHVFPPDMEYIIPPDDPDGFQPVFKQVVTEQISLMLKAEALLRQAARSNPIVLTSHVIKYQLDVPDRIIHCVDGSCRAYYETTERVEDGFVISVPARFVYGRRKGGHLHLI